MTWARKLTVEHAEAVAQALRDNPVATLRSACAAAGVEFPRVRETLRRVEDNGRAVPSETDHKIYAILERAQQERFDELRREAILASDATEGVRAKPIYHGFVRHLLETQDPSHKPVQKTELAQDSDAPLVAPMSMDEIRKAIQADLAKAKGE